MKLTLAILCAVLTVALTVTGWAGEALKIVLVGDSTVASYCQEEVTRGWGHYLSPSVKIVNLAKPGRSTKTYFETGLWQQALDAKPDYIFIQFGHNDSHGEGRPESTDAATDFREYLRRYVAEARQAGAKPVMVTPMHRLVFSNSTGKPSMGLKPYVDAMKQVGAELNVPVIDLYRLSSDAFEPPGEAGVAGLTVSDKDRTHFTEKGARILAKLVTDEAIKLNPRLVVEAQSK